MSLSMYLVVGFMLSFISIMMGVSGSSLKFNEILFVFEYQLVGLGGGSVSFEVVFDWMGALYMGAVLFISGSVVIYSEDYSGGDVHKDRFLWLMVSFIMSMSLSVMSGNLISVMLGWDGLGLVSYLLVIYYQSSSSYKSGMITILSNRIGDVLLLVSIGLLVGVGSWNYFVLESGGMTMFLSLMVVIASCTKSAQIPFSAWLPEAMAAPTPVSSLVHSSTLVTAGVFLSIRFNYLFLGGLCKGVLMGSSLLTMSVAGLGASVEMDLKKVVAMSTLSQLGLMMFSLSSGSWVVAFFHSVMHAFFKSLMFMSVGSLLRGSGGDQDIRFSSGKFLVSPLVNQGLLISVLCLSGFPFYCGFYSKDMLLEVYLMTSKGGSELLLSSGGFSFSVLYGVRLFNKGSVLSGEGGKKMSNFGEMKFMDLGVVMMSVLSLSGGSVYSWLSGGVELIMLGSFLKIMGLIISAGGSSSMSYLLGGGELGGEKSNFSFMGSMWNFSSFSGKSWGVYLEYCGSMEDDDQGWVEELGGGGGDVMVNKSIDFYERKLGMFMVSGSGMVILIIVVLF